MSYRPQAGSILLALVFVAAALPRPTALAETASSATGVPTKDGAATPATAAQAAAGEIYASSCVSCHGPRGGGDGLAAAGLPKKPASFSDPAWQAATSDEEIERAILDGGRAVGKSPLMPPNPELRARPAVVAALREMIRGFRSSAELSR
jgi:mono/diheme cytochrome c family protein